MKLGIVSDTHDNLDVVAEAVDLFEAEADAVVHCGDIVSPFAAQPFDADFEFFAVRGNNDGEWALKDAVEEFGRYMGEMGELTIDGELIAVYHGTSEPMVEALCGCGTYDYVLHGHSHRRLEETWDDTVRINPGGIAISPDGGDQPPAGVVLDTESGDVTFHDLR
ncbi:metallophosphoesterase [Halobacteriales archaeon Cl-PHB]